MSMFHKAPTRQAALAAVQEQRPDAHGWIVGEPRRDGTRDVVATIRQDIDEFRRVTRRELWNVSADGVATLIS